ncbi:hypothetical protein BV22DRAFT_1200082 [Leucogyrophana mollusca]|uniref:Uncharacterized protein n=1 Tax=Leucogyrophana mollusca TaxID=85980 RepID=A0ACB8AY27_9AGAM|nr:hypothetical protein BV22DRAFT_1200082 [Leucogyrophana mollusca]
MTKQQQQQPPPGVHLVLTGRRRRLSHVHAEKDAHLAIPLSSGKTLSLVRRDLFDARPRLISEGTGDEDAEGAGDGEGPARVGTSASALHFLDAPSDLMPFVHEGGPKT